MEGEARMELQRRTALGAQRLEPPLAAGCSVEGGQDVLRARDRECAAFLQKARHRE
jgi:hypothetical protein